MIVDEWISLVGTVAVLVIAAGVVIAIVRSRRPGAGDGQRRAGTIATVGLVVGLLLAAAAILVLAALASSDGRFRF